MLATRMILVGYLVLTDFPNVRDKGKHFGGCSLCHNIPNFLTNHECNLFHNMPNFGTNHAIGTYQPTLHIEHYKSTTAPGCTLFSGLKKLTWRTGLGGC